MHRKEKEILNELKEAVSSFNLEVGNEVWGAIEHELDAVAQERKRRGVVWWMHPILSVLGFFIVGLVIFRAEKNPVAFQELRQINQKIPNTKPQVTALPAVSNTEQDQHIVNSQKADPNAFNTVEDQEKFVLTDPEIPLYKGTAIRFIAEQASVKLDERLESKINQDFNDTTTNDTISSNGDLKTPVLDLGDLEVQQKRNWSVMIYGGPGVSYRTLRGTGAQTIVDHRNAHERQTVTYDAGMLSQMSFGKSSYLRFGLNYSRYAEKYVFSHDIISHTTVNVSSYGQLNLNYGRSLTKFENSDIVIFSGLGLGRLIHARSSWVDPGNFVPVSHSNNQPNQPFETWIINYRFAVDYSLVLEKKLKLHIFPCMEGVLNSSYRKETELNQHPYAINLNVGISYNL